MSKYPADKEDDNSEAEYFTEHGSYAHLPLWAVQGLRITNYVLRDA
ncbi:MAG: hypothetical protein HYZ22_01275 [Chloroflexi bacterium]|nr:hypothetical protein [Chloroflexota bacterium]